MQQHTTIGTQAETLCGSVLHANRGAFGNDKIWARTGRWHS
jgi:hypothetical protein